MLKAGYENPFPREADLARGKLAILANGLQQLAVALIGGRRSNCRALTDRLREYLETATC
jgi:hypothetical protein